MMRGCLSFPPLPTHRPWPQTKDFPVAQAHIQPIAGCTGGRRETVALRARKVRPGRPHVFCRIVDVDRQLDFGIGRHPAAGAGKNFCQAFSWARTPGQGAVELSGRWPNLLLEPNAMKGEPQILDALNRALTIELTAINQYFCQAKMCKNWGFNKLAKKHYEESIGEMKHAELLIDRILFLDGTPEIARYDVIRVGSDIKEQFENDLVLEVGGVKHYNAVVELCVKLMDNGTRELVAPILVESEEHVDWLETQLGLIKSVGLQNYLTEQIGDPE
jgi:bacterioferritin